MTRTILVGAALAALVATDAAAQWNVARTDAAPNRVYATFGLDPALVSTIGYGRVFDVDGHAVQLSADLGVVTAKVDARDFRQELGINVGLVRWRALHLTGSASAITRGTDNALYRGYNFGADFTASLGVYRPRWFLAAEAGKDKAVITHIRHSAWYRERYPDAKSGWYLDAGGTIHRGVLAGVVVKNAELAMRVGTLVTEKHKEMLPPIYMTLGVGVAY